MLEGIGVKLADYLQVLFTQTEKRSSAATFDFSSVLSLDNLNNIVLLAIFVFLLRMAFRTVFERIPDKFIDFVLLSSLACFMLVMIWFPEFGQKVEYGLIYLKHIWQLPT
ncbi:hypothetical protein [Carboxydothermus ferrireducens]|uniref:hypothetical protein n=1 Tax=Carboxydothermus ferrireducens TaxID=54265 RepID=UPI0012B52976|nr:hypothetical protein [Carboxydothermus ferrireducens]